MSATNGAAYMVLVSEVDDALVGASVDPAVAAKTEVHETVAAGAGSPTTMMGGPETTMMAGGETPSTMMGETPSSMVPGSGEMMMRPVERIELPAGEDVVLEPGGYHVMLIDLATPLVVGTTFELTLQFEQAGSMTVEVPVRDAAP